MKIVSSNKHLNQIQTFQFESQLIPTVIENGEVYFAVNELAQVLGFSNPRQAITSHVDKEDVQKLDTLTQGGNQKKSFVNESGMYALVFGSSKPEAKRFKKWVTSEVLPSIRKTGKYEVSKLSTKEERKPLRQAVTMLVDKKGISYEDAYHLIHQRFDIESVEELNQNQINEAIQYIHSLIVKGNELPALTPEYFTHLAQMIAGAHKYAQIQTILESKDGKKQRKILLDGWLESTYKNEKRGFLFFLDFELNDAISRAQRFLMQQASLLQQF